MDTAKICRDRHDRRSCKIFANCVNFPGKQRDFLNNMRRSPRFTHTKCDFALKLLKFYTFVKFIQKSLRSELPIPSSPRRRVINIFLPRPLDQSEHLRRFNGVSTPLGSHNPILFISKNKDTSVIRNHQRELYAKLKLCKQIENIILYDQKPINVNQWQAI